MNRSNTKKRNVTFQMKPLLQAISWLSFFLGVVLIIFIWLPLRLQSRPLRYKLINLSQQLDKQAYEIEYEKLFRNVESALANESELKMQLSYWINWRNSFTNRHETAVMLSDQEDRRIDFKIALFNARTNLMTLAESRNAVIPDDIGINETLSTDTRVETALGQLFATVHLVDLVMNSGIKRIRTIHPLTLRMHSLLDSESGRMRNYPIRIEAETDFEQCLNLLALLGKSNSGYALEHISLFKAIPSEPETNLILQIVATASRPLGNRRGKRDERNHFTEETPFAEKPVENEQDKDTVPVTNHWYKETSR